MSRMFIFIAALIVSFSSEGQSFFLGQNVPRAMICSQSNSKLSLSSQVADSTPRNMAIASAAAGSEEIDWFAKTPVACCADDMCFMEPPATETGLTIRCLLSQNGLDVDWINPEDEEAVPKETNMIMTDFSDYDDEDEAEE